MLICTAGDSRLEYHSLCRDYVHCQLQVHFTFHSLSPPVGKLIAGKWFTETLPLWEPCLMARKQSVKNGDSTLGTRLFCNPDPLSCQWYSRQVIRKQGEKGQLWCGFLPQNCSRKEKHGSALDLYDIIVVRIVVHCCTRGRRVLLVLNYRVLIMTCKPLEQIF